MKKGLLLKDAPEPIYLIGCWTCKMSFHDSHDYQLHRRLIHNERLTIQYEKYESKYSSTGWVERYYKQWVIIGSELDQGRMDIPHQLPVRPKRRIMFTIQEINNRNSKLCHCGKPPTPPRRKYCSDSCTGDWYRKTIFVNQHRDEFLSKSGGKCEMCGKVESDKYKLEMDHIIALIFGGHPWDERNLQGLCYNCHKIKSKSDMGILAYWKRECKYDIGFKTLINDEPRQIIK